MAANYSTNPTNPTNQSGGQPQGQVDPNAITQKPRDPKNIRDYLSAARAQGATPTFTNKPGGQGFMVEDEPTQAISEGPQNEYERLPFAQRMKMSPYIRAQERTKAMLPKLFESVFPGMQQGAILDEDQMKHWEAAVGSLTANLLKHFDKQYEWSLKNETADKSQKLKDEKHWHSKFVDAQLRGQPALNRETGQELTAAEFIEERMSVQDEMKFKHDTQIQERRDAARKDEIEFSPAKVGPILRANPDLAAKVKQAAIQAMQGIAGYTPSEQEFDSWQSDPKWSYAMDQATERALQQFEEEIMQLMGQ